MSNQNHGQLSLTQAVNSPRNRRYQSVPQRRFQPPSPSSKSQRRFFQPPSPISKSSTFFSPCSKSSRIKNNCYNQISSPFAWPPPPPVIYSPSYTLNSPSYSAYNSSFSTSSIKRFTFLPQSTTECVDSNNNTVNNISYRSHTKSNTMTMTAVNKYNSYTSRSMAIPSIIQSSSMPLLKMVPPPPPLPPPRLKLKRKRKHRKKKQKKKKKKKKRKRRKSKIINKSLYMTHTRRKSSMRFDCINTFISLNGIKTYDVIYNARICGLELTCFDENKNIGAVVSKCHNIYSKRRVIVKSLLIGVGDIIVVTKNYNDILENIRSAKRPVKLTFYPPKNIALKELTNKHEPDNALNIWLGKDDIMRFKPMHQQIGM